MEKRNQINEREEILRLVFQPFHLSFFINLPKPLKGCSKTRKREREARKKIRLEGERGNGGGINQAGRIAAEYKTDEKIHPPPSWQAKDLRAADYFPIIYSVGGGGQRRVAAVFRAGVGGTRERARTDTIAAINTGESRGSDVTGEGPILYFISKLIPREQIYCKKGVKKYTFSLCL